MLRITESNIIIDVNSRKLVNKVTDEGKMTTITGAKYDDLLDTDLIKQFFLSFCRTKDEYYNLVNACSKCLCPETFERGQVLIFYGKPRSGKSVCADAIVNAMGLDNCGYYTAENFDKKLLVKKNIKWESFDWNLANFIANKTPIEVYVGMGNIPKKINRDSSVILVSEDNPIFHIPDNMKNKVQIIEFTEWFLDCKENAEFVKNIMGNRDKLLSFLVNRLLSLDDVDSDEFSNDEDENVIKI